MDPSTQKPGQVFSPQGGNNTNPDLNIPQEPADNLPSATPDQPSNSDPAKKRRIIIVVLGVLLLIFIISVAIAALSGGKSEEGTSTNEQTDSQILGSQPAQAIDVEQTSNSINNDLSGLDDSADFSKDDLSDDSLDL